MAWLFSWGSVDKSMIRRFIFMILLVCSACAPSLTPKAIDPHQDKRYVIAMLLTGLFLYNAFKPTR